MNENASGMRQRLWVKVCDKIKERQSQPCKQDVLGGVCRKQMPLGQEKWA